MRQLKFYVFTYSTNINCLFCAITRHWGYINEQKIPFWNLYPGRGWLGQWFILGAKRFCKHFPYINLTNLSQHL